MTGVIHDLDAVRQGFDVSCDVVIVGSGAGGAVAAANCAAAGMDTILVEAGPHLAPEDMTRDAPQFLARNYWEGGLRLVGGTAPNPCMQGRCVGGSTVMNSAIMYALPPWVRHIWAAEDGLDAVVLDPSFERAFQRIFRATRVQPTPLTIMGPRNRAVQAALQAAGIASGPLPRAVEGCEGSGDCITGCHTGAKQSVDRAYIDPATRRHGLRVFTCSHVERVLTQRGRATGVVGRVVDPDGRRTVGRFSIHAKTVILAASVTHTPVILMKSGIYGRRGHGGLAKIGGNLQVHVTAGAVAFMDEPTDPWVGATQGWGAISQDIRGLKYEAIWAAPSLIGLNWGDIGVPFLRALQTMKHAALVACVYRGRVHGRVKARRDGSPDLKVWIPDSEAHTVLRGLKRALDGFLDTGAHTIMPSVHGVSKTMRTRRDTEALLSTGIKARDINMTFNHIFGSCRMSADPNRGPVAPDGSVRGVDDLYICDSSLFPSPSAVNPQATIMALSDVISRRVAGLDT